MKNILVQIYAHFMAALMMTFLVGIVLFCVFWFSVGLVSFAVWHVPSALPSAWLVARFCISIGVLISLFFVLSEEGMDVADNFARHLK